MVDFDTNFIQCCQRRQLRCSPRCPEQSRVGRFHNSSAFWLPTCKGPLQRTITFLCDHQCLCHSLPPMIGSLGRKLHLSVFIIKFLWGFRRSGSWLVPLSGAYQCLSSFASVFFILQDFFYFTFLKKTKLFTNGKNIVEN